MKTVAATAVVLAAVLAACSASPVPSVPSPSPAQPTPSPERPGRATPAVSPLNGSRLEGTWRTGTVTTAQVEETLRSAGLHRWIQPLRTLEDHPQAESAVFTLTIQGGTWDLDWAPDGAQPIPIDYGHSYEIDGDRVTVIDDSGRFNRYRWSVEGDTLQLTWLETTYPPYRDIPEEVFQRAFYTTAPFERQP